MTCDKSVTCIKTFYHCTMTQPIFSANGRDGNSRDVFLCNSPLLSWTALPRLCGIAICPKSMKKRLVQRRAKPHSPCLYDLTSPKMHLQCSRVVKSTDLWRQYRWLPHTLFCAYKFGLVVIRLAFGLFVPSLWPVFDRTIQEDFSTLFQCSFSFQMDHFFQVLVVHYCVLAEIQQETCTPDPEGAKIQKTVLGSQTRLDDHHGITYAYGTLLMEFYTIVMYVLYLGDMC